MPLYPEYYSQEREVNILALGSPAADGDVSFLIDVYSY